MDTFKVFFLILLVGIARSSTEDDGFAEVDEMGLDDFPLDDAGGGVTDRVDEGGGDDLNNLEDINLSDLEQTEASRQELLRKVMSAAMSKPGARQRLAQVMPILRTMSATQRLALAGLVTSQLMAAPGATPPPITVNDTKSNLTDDLMIPISMDIAAMFRGLGRDATAARSNLFRGELYKRHPPYRRRPVQSLNRRNTEVAFEGEMRPPPQMPGRVKPPKLMRPLPGKMHLPSPALVTNMVADTEAGTDCQLFSSNLCLQVSDYPMEAILKSIQNTPNKNAFEALRKDSKQDFGDIYMDKEPHLERRQGGLSVDPQEDKHMCSSKVEVARPKRARATSGQWKYVVNTGDYTQTLRLEMCLKPKQPCSFLSEMKSECVQVYNYHRLLTWDQKSGLTMDIFKVPTCCSCHVHGPSHPFLAGQPLLTQTASESIRQQSAPVEPVRHVTPPPRITYTEPSENNFVAAAEERPTVLRLPPKQIFTRRPIGGLHNIPKRESPGRLPPHRTLPPRQHLAQESQEDRRYSPPQYENLLRRTISNSNSSENDVRPKYHPVLPTLNQRHPELPVDSLLADNTFSFVTSEPDYLPAKNYQEHPPRYHSPPPTTYSTTPKRIVYQTTYPSTPKRVVYQTYQTTLPPPSTTSRRQVYQTTPSSATPGGGKRVNYSYHPIIDFFKTSVTATEHQEIPTNAEWTPITDQPRLLPAQ